MANCFETAMCVMLDTAVFFIMLNVIKNNGKNETFGRLAALNFGTGFLTGLAAKFISGGSAVIICLYALGFMLSYAAFVFSVPEKRKRNDCR